MKERKSTTIKKSKVLIAYQNTGGNVRLSCRMANAGKSQFYVWLKVDSQFRMQIEKILKTIVKCGEDKVLAKAIEGDATAWKLKVYNAKKVLAQISTSPQTTVNQYNT